MITSNELYKKFLLKVNKNDTNSNIKVPKSQFVLLFNEQKRIWLNNIVKEYESSDYIEDISELLVLDEPLIKIKENLNNDSFELPKNFYKRVTGYAVTNKDECKNNIIVIWFIKPKNKDIYLQNSNLNPSFEYQETIGIINNNKVLVFKSDFKIDEVYFSYYKEPVDIDIKGYINIDGSQSADVNTDLDDDNAEYIINLTALAAVTNYENVEAVQLAAARK